MAKKTKRNQRIDAHKIAHPKKRAYLSAYAKSGTHQAAVKATRICRRTHYDWLERDPAYAAAFEDAKEDAADSLEAEAISRARDGWLEPVFYEGRIVGHVLKKSDTLLIFTLKGLRPEKYRERFEHTGKNGAPLAATNVIVLPSNGRASR